MTLLELIKELLRIQAAGIPTLLKMMRLEHFIPNATLLQHYQFSLFLTTAITAAFGLWVFVQKRKSKLAQLFCLYSLGVAFWSYCQAMVSVSNDASWSLAWIRIMFHAVITFPVLLTHFFSTFLGVDKRKVCLVGWLLVFGFLPFLWSDQFLHEGPPLGFLPAFPRTGPLFPFFNLVWAIWVLYDFWILGRASLGRSRLPTTRQRKLLLGAFIFGYATSCVNYLYMYGICITPLQPFATYGAPIGFLIVAYGIFAYRLFDIHVVIRRSLVYSLLVTSLTIGYFSLVHFIERIFQTTFGYQSVGLSLAAFALMALAFQPLKLAIQRLVDHLFFRAQKEGLVRTVERLKVEVRQTEKFKTISMLAAGLAHEIKNPLAAIKTFTEYLGTRYDDPDFRARFQRIVGGEVERINLIVQQLLDFAKPSQPKLAPVDVPRLLDETVQLLDNDFLRRGIDVKRRYDGNESVLGDPQQLRQVFLNLLLNSLDAMNGDGRLDLAIAVRGAELEVTIADNGAGIAPEDLPHVFDPFFSTKTNGTGLGLAIVQGIVQEHRGHIEVQSRPGQGTTMHLFLPAAAE